jgi:hypothetical protein
MESPTVNPDGTSQLNAYGMPNESRHLLYSRRLDASQCRIRVLSFESASDQGEAMHFGMLEIPLDDDVGIQYAALSYTWNNPTPEQARKNPWITERISPFDYAPRWIYINRQEIRITANLFFALQRLRSRFEHQPPIQCLWVDAVCINQADGIEKTAQLKLMGEVYRNAADVLVWLGEEEGETDSEIAIDLLQNVYHSFISFAENDEEANDWANRMFQQAEHQQLERRLATSGVPLGEMLNFSAELILLQGLWIERTDFHALDVRCDARAWASVARLLERSWFTRLWTYQEKSLARSTTLFVGGKSMSWNHANTVMGLITNHDNIMGRTKVLPKGEARKFFESAMPSEAKVVAYGGSHQNLFDVVRTASSRGCSDPRDKIYGVLGTMNKDDAGFEHISAMMDNGDPSVQNLYTDFARFYLEDRRDLRVLQSCSCYPERMQGLPSWAPDWSKPQFGNMLPKHAYRAAAEWEPMIGYQSNTHEMLVSGIVIDRVAVLAPLAHADLSAITAMDHSELTTLASTCLRHFACLYLGDRNIEYPHNLTRKWIELAERIKWDEPYPSVGGESNAEAYWRTLIGDMDPYALAEVFSRRAPADLSISNLAEVWLDLKPLPADYQPQEADDRVRRANYFFRVSARIQATTIGKHFYLTEKGLMGLGTHNAEENDIVVVFLGCDSPMLLRKHEDHYTVVGETYGMFRHFLREKRNG